MQNSSGLMPVGRAILIEPYEPERKAGMIEIPETIRRNSAALEVRARVIECGPSAWEDEKHPRADPGDLVMVTKFAGFIAIGPADGKTYRLVNDRDVFCRIIKESDDE